jgi:hypothetical protein
MTDLHTRFQTLDDLSAPDLWYDIEERAMAMQLTPRRTSWVMFAVLLLLALAIGGAALVGSGIVKLPVSVEASPTQSSSAESATPSSTPVVFRAPAWTATANMSWARAGHTATLLPDGKVLVAGGTAPAGGVHPGGRAELYDPVSGTWSATGNLNESFDGQTATLLPTGKVLVVAGSAELYDPASGTWTATGNTGAGSGAGYYGETATLLPDGHVLAAGRGSAELYNPSSGTWSVTGRMIEVRENHTAVLLPNGKVLVVGGGNGEYAVASAELYDPATRTWTATGSMIAARSWMRATLLPNGKVLVTGGLAVHQALASAELYDPVSGTWTATGSMSEPRGRFPTATLLPDGTVLLAGGCCGAGSSFLASAELYDSTSGTWTSTVSMNEARFDHTATLLPNGTVLVVGGLADEGDPSTVLATAELYDPGSGN